MSAPYGRDWQARAAYEEELRRCPLYPDGGKRRAWDELPDVAKDVWRRKPWPVTKLKASQDA